MDMIFFDKEEFEKRLEEYKSVRERLLEIKEEVKKEKETCEGCRGYSFERQLSEVLSHCERSEEQMLHLVHMAEQILAVYCETEEKNKRLVEQSVRNCFPEESGTGVGAADRISPGMFISVNRMQHEDWLIERAFEFEWEG